MKHHEAVAWDAMLAVYEEANTLVKRVPCMWCGLCLSHAGGCRSDGMRRLVETADRALIEYDAAETLAQRAMEVTP